MEIKSVLDADFRKYGKVLEGYDFSALLRAMRHTPVPEDVVYVPSCEEMESLEVAKELQNKGFGGLPIQIGYCNGHIEEDFTYDTSKIEAFLVPAGTGIEVYGTTLHYAPCNTEDSGFQCVVVLPKGTNTELTFPVKETGEEKLMTAKNKWLIGHE